MPVLIVLPPLLPDGWRQAVVWAFSNVCHQLPDRTFHVHGVGLAVCQRCVGIYAGLAAAVLLWPLMRPFAAALGRQPLMLLAAGLIPLSIDWALGATGLWANTPLSRSATGLLFGLTAGLLLARALQQLGDGPEAPAAVTNASVS